jgi:hypothetical protein
MANVCQAGNGLLPPSAADHLPLAGTEAGGRSGQLPRVKSRREPQAFPSHTMAYQHSNSYASSYKYRYFDRTGFSGMPPAEARAPIFQGVHDA